MSWLALAAIQEYNMVTPIIITSHKLTITFGQYVSCQSVKHEPNQAGLPRADGC